MEQNQMEMFDELNTNHAITTEELDEAVKAMSSAKTEYEKKKAISDEAYHTYQNGRAKLIAMMQSANKSKYSVDDVGTISISTKLKVRTPQTPEAKGEFFAWLNGQFGADGFLTYVGINYQTLQSLYNKEFEAATDEGLADSFTIPGIDSPQSEPSLSFRK